jgi:hypothetical protein
MRSIRNNKEPYLIATRKVRSNLRFLQFNDSLNVTDSAANEAGLNCGPYTFSLVLKTPHTQAMNGVKGAQITVRFPVEGCAVIATGGISVSMRAVNCEAIVSTSFLENLKRLSQWSPVQSGIPCLDSNLTFALCATIAWRFSTARSVSDEFFKRRTNSVISMPNTVEPIRNRKSGDSL